METKANTRIEPLLLPALIVCCTLLAVGSVVSLIGLWAWVAACFAGTLPILTTLLLRTWSMNLAAYEGRLPPEFQWRPPREAKSQ